MPLSHCIYLFQACNTELADFQDISGLAISGLENFENKRITSVYRIQEKNLLISDYCT
jgi:hypothetical protein